MDLWVVAAATGAGHVAKYWQSLTSKETESSSESLSVYSIHKQFECGNLLLRKQDQTNTFWRVAGKHDTDGFLLDEEDFGGVTITNNSRRQGENNENLNLLSVISFSQVLADNENFRVIGNGMLGNINLCEASGHLRSSYHGNYLEPLDSTQSSLRAQLYRAYVELEEYLYNTVPSRPRPTVRPLLLRDGRQIISRPSRELIAENEMPLLSTKLENDIRRRSRRFSTTRESIQPFHSQGFHNAKFSFFLGISVGIMSALITNRSKVENMNALIMETEKLAQDLQEELEMSDLMNIKEIDNKDFEVLGTNEHQSFSGTPFAPYTEQETDDQKEEKYEATSKIEAELAAELERLELNMRKSSFETISGPIDRDSDFVTHVVHGDLKLDAANDEAGSLSYPDNEVSESSTNHPDETKDAVSPWELSLRLHKVIQSRLEERIMELVTALENSQRRLHSLEMESILAWRDYYGKVESTSQESQLL